MTTKKNQQNTAISHEISWAHPLVRQWFLKKFDSATKPQVLGWPAIVKGKATLISAPTGSGKTLAAFLVSIDHLVRRAILGKLPAQTLTVYVSPLKALGNDIQKNLLAPLHEIKTMAEKQNRVLQEIRVAVRTGDTLAHERQKMLRKPPHILVTTPESLYILLTAVKSREMLSTVTTLIVDEIHALADNKRGAHLSLSMERLEALTGRSLLRIGLSATVRPAEDAGHFLMGSRPLPYIVQTGHRRRMQLSIELPKTSLNAIASNAMWDEIYDQIAVRIQQNRSTLIFVSTRRLAERLTHHLAERIGENEIRAHHGSLSRQSRLQSEMALKNGTLKALVATASLELGIDIGSIDLVCQIGSTHSIAAALQRIGRSGHWRGAIPCGIFYPMTRDKLLECAAIIHAILTDDLDKLVIPEMPLDILMQQLIALCATDEWKTETLYRLVKQSFYYLHLLRSDFDRLITVLSEGIAGSRGRYGAWLYHDTINDRLKARRGARIHAIINGGAIPENGLFRVISEPDGMMVGTLDEDFAVESHRDDIILLGSTSWKILRVESSASRVIVSNANGAPPTIPFWLGEAPARTAELSRQFSDLRASADPVFLQQSCHMDENAAQQAVQYIQAGKTVLGRIPTQQEIVAERFFDESGGMQLIIHAPFGARINKAWALALRKRFCRSFNFELQASATDEGFNISLTEQHSFPLMDVFQMLNVSTIEKVLTQAVLQSPIFVTRWRWNATRSLALLRYRNGKKIPPYILRMRADDLLAAVFPQALACQDNLRGEDIPVSDHPLVQETLKDILNDFMSLGDLTTVLKKIEAGEIRCYAVDTSSASVFSHEILNTGPSAWLDDAPLEERRTRAVSLRGILPESVLEGNAILDQEVINQVKAQAWPDLRDADELHDTLQTLMALPSALQSSAWQVYFAELEKTGRALIFDFKNTHFWIPAEKKAYIDCIYTGRCEPGQEEEKLILLMLKGWLMHTGPVTAEELAVMTCLSVPVINRALIHLEAGGFVLRGHFRDDPSVVEWCERRLLARIHRLTLDKLRRSIQPVSRQQYNEWLAEWQHTTPENRLSGEVGLLEIIQQLQGREMPAREWEESILPVRMLHYEKEWLDRLCLSGRVGWGRFSTPAAMRRAEKKRIRPTGTMPVTLYLRNEFGISDENLERNTEILSSKALEIYSWLKNHGASFTEDIVVSTGHLLSEVEEALWELAAGGFVTSDSFDNLRAFINPVRRLRKKRRGFRRYAFLPVSGRWSLLLPKKLERKEYIQQSCHILLRRYGVVFRDNYDQEKNLPPWRFLLQAFRRMEEKGEIRGGRFVDFAGEQYALPEAVEALRQKTF